MRRFIAHPDWKVNAPTHLSPACDSSFCTCWRRCPRTRGTGSRRRARRMEEVAEGASQHLQMWPLLFLLIYSSTRCHRQAALWHCRSWLISRTWKVLLSRLFGVWRTRAHTLGRRNLIPFAAMSVMHVGPKKNHQTAAWSNMKTCENSKALSLVALVTTLIQERSWMNWNMYVFLFEDSY